MRSGFLFLSIVMVSLGASVFAYDWTTNPGDGSPENPYQISTPEQMMSIGSDSVLLTKHYILTSDIVFDPDTNPAHVFTTALIAPDSSYNDWSYVGVPFTGSFNGANYTIQNFKIAAQLEGSGLADFGVLSDNWP